MIKRTAAALTLSLVLAPTLVACGDDEGADTSAARPGATTAAPAPAPKSEIPAELSGTWEATIRYSELDDPPDDLKKGRTSVWALEVLPTGGIDNGPSLYLANDTLGEFVNPVSVSDDQVTLQEPHNDDPAICSMYPYRVEGEQLTLTVDESECPSVAFSSVLTARPWRRAAR